MKIKEIINNYAPAQAIAIWLLSALAILLFTTNKSDSINSWLFSGSGVLLYAIGNPLLGIFNKNWLRYTGLSLATHLLLTFALYNLAQYSCDLPVSATRHYKAVFLSLFVFYFLAVGLTALFRFIILSLEGTSN